MKATKDGWVTRIGGLVGSSALRSLVSTLSYRIVPEHPWMNPFASDCPFNYIFCLWHDCLIYPAVAYSGLKQYTLVSQSGDGELITRIATRLGWTVIRGSSTRGAAGALRRMMELGQARQPIHIAITADGPRGPRHVLKDGPIYLASRTGLRILPVGIAHQNPWRAKSWDRFIIPKPFSKVVMYGASPIHVPPDADRATIDRYRLQAQAEMDRAEQEAERLLSAHVAGEKIESLTPRRAA